MQNSSKHVRWSILQKIVTGLKLLTIFKKGPILDIW